MEKKKSDTRELSEDLFASLAHALDLLDPGQCYLSSAFATLKQDLGITDEEFQRFLRVDLEKLSERNTNSDEETNYLQQREKLLRGHLEEDLQKIGHFSPFSLEDSDLPLRSEFELEKIEKHESLALATKLIVSAEEARRQNEAKRMQRFAEETGITPSHEWRPALTIVEHAIRDNIRNHLAIDRGERNERREKLSAPPSRDAYFTSHARPEAETRSLIEFVNIYLRFLHSERTRKAELQLKTLWAFLRRISAQLDPETRQLGAALTKLQHKLGLSAAQLRVFLKERKSSLTSLLLLHGSLEEIEVRLAMLPKDYVPSFLRSADEIFSRAISGLRPQHLAKTSKTRESSSESSPSSTTDEENMDFLSRLKDTVDELKDIDVLLDYDDETLLRLIRRVPTHTMRVATNTQRLISQFRREQSWQEPIFGPALALLCSTAYKCEMEGVRYVDCPPFDGGSIDSTGAWELIEKLLSYCIAGTTLARFPEDEEDRVAGRYLSAIKDPDVSDAATLVAMDYVEYLVEQTTSHAKTQD